MRSRISGQYTSLEGMPSFDDQAEDVRQSAETDSPITRRRTIIVPDSFGLPVGLDKDSIGFNIQALDEAARLIGTKTIRIAGFKGEEDKLEVQGNINPDGSLTGAKSKLRSADSRRTRSIQHGVDECTYFDLLHTAQINNEVRKNDFHGAAEECSTEKQATSLNDSVKKLLHAYNLDRNLTRGFRYPKFIIADCVLFSFTATAAATTFIDLENIPNSRLGGATALSILGLIAYSREAAKEHLRIPEYEHHEPHHGYASIVKPYRYIRAARHIAKKNL